MNDLITSSPYPWWYRESKSSRRKMNDYSQGPYLILLFSFLCTLSGVHCSQWNGHSFLRLSLANELVIRLLRRGDHFQKAVYLLLCGTVKLYF